MMFLVICIFLIVWYLTFRLCPLKIEHPTRQMIPYESLQAGIPRRIWTFWNSEKIPEIVSACIGTWKKHCPEYEITILTPRTLCNTLPNAQKILKLPFANTPQRQADFIRLHVLYQHGGYWLDASIIMFQTLDVFGQHQQRDKSEFVGFYLNGFTTDPYTPVIENWFFGCVKGSAFVGMWRDEFMRINDYSSAMAYVDHARLNNIRINGIPYLLSHYLSMHVAAQVVIQHHTYPIMERSSLQTAESGPFQYLQTNKWISKEAISWLVSRKQDGSNMPPFIKLRGSERMLLQNDPAALEILTRTV